MTTSGRTVIARLAHGVRKVVPAALIRDQMRDVLRGSAFATSEGATPPGSARSAWAGLTAPRMPADLVADLRLIAASNY